MLAAAGYLLFRQKILGAVVMFLTALAVNTVMLVMTHAQIYFTNASIAEPVWRYAMVSEEYFAWIALAASVVTARAWTALFDSDMGERA